MDPDRSTVCVREVQKSLDQSVKRLIEQKIEALGVGAYFEIQKTAILSRNGEGRIIFVGMQDHTAESVKSLEGYDCAWVEEAQSLSDHSLRLLRPTIRKPGSELWFTWNPKSADDAVDKLLRGPKAPPDAIVVRVNSEDNPWFPDVLRAEREFDRVNEPARFEHVWEGGYDIGGEGRVYQRFDRRIHCVDPWTVQPGTGRIAIACDFNYRAMRWIVAEVDDPRRVFHVVGEVCFDGGTTTDEHAERTAQWIAGYMSRTRGRRFTREDVFAMKIKAYTDASGTAMHTSSTLSDEHLLLKAGFRPMHHTRNPRVMDRVNTVNVLFRDRRITVDRGACPELVKALETQAMDKNGEPEKKTGAADLSHIVDALGYLAYYEFPVFRDGVKEKAKTLDTDEWGPVL